ncbi:MAG: sugar ABC transporter permease [Spirochaetota bacterium]
MDRDLSYVRKKHLLFVLLTLGPVLALFMYIRIIPIIKTAFYSFTSYSLIKPKAIFIGLRNYEAMLRDDSFRQALSNTLVISLVCVAATLAIALLLSVIIRRVGKISALYELLYFLPVVTPWVPASVIWRWLLDPAHGMINQLLSFLGLPSQSWLQKPDQVIFAIIIISIWKTVGYYMIIFSVGLRNIPDIFYEAARIDGAGNWKQFRYITLPLLKPIFLFAAIMAFIQYFNVFTVAYVVSSDSQGSPSYECKVLVWEIYRNGFNYYKMGYASAEAMVLLLLVFIVVLLQFKVAGKNVE